MPSPYKTNCFDYQKIQCKSRQHCIDKCNIDYTIKHFNSLPSHTIFNKRNHKNNISSICHRLSDCFNKYNKPDCTDQCYNLKPLQVTNLGNNLNNSFNHFIKHYPKGFYYNLITNDIDK